ncbi:unnamed protein product [Thelazia callipaeda]|uniref:Endoplasmic reticulum lectin 1 n=1 Tax=Thelazia callipaeda TaxID=103827 RepID=A0A0N5DBB4_THECL|nr:unnamed protein product [Thelazia callipaeda]
MFRIDWKKESTTPKQFVKVDDDLLSSQPYIHISSVNGEKYLCTLPTIFTKTKKDDKTYTGLSPAQLIQSLYDNRICSYWLDLYWTYELCHGRYIMQFHEDREARNARTEYYLGNYGREQSKLDEKSFDEFNPPRHKINYEDHSYYPVTYRQGTVCDLTGKPRTTTVMYMCKLDAKDQIYSFSETASCTYEMVVHTKHLCSHPSFQPLPTDDHEIVCYSKDPFQENAKPKQLLISEKEDQTALEKEYRSSLQLKVPASNIYFKKSRHIDDIDDENDERGSNLDTSVTAHKQKFSSLEDEQNGYSIASSSKVDPDQLLEETRYLLSGKQCLYSRGTGWWKYEFCFGKSIIQFHDNPGGKRSEILLGLFNLDIHKHWIDDNPQKKPLRIDGRVTQVSYMYAGGAACKEANIHRSVEVRVRCRTSSGSQTAVTIYLLEPYKCQYILGVESARFCDLLQTVDQYGLIQLPETSDNNAV